MARTYKVVNGKLKITEPQPPIVILADSKQFSRRIDRLNAKIESLDARIASLQSEKTDLESELAELTPYIGQI